MTINQKVCLPVLDEISAILLQVTRPGFSVVVATGRLVVCTVGSRINGMLLDGPNVDVCPVVKLDDGIGSRACEVLEKPCVVCVKAVGDDVNDDADGDEDDTISLSAKWLKSVGETVTISPVGFGCGFGDLVV